MTFFEYVRVGAPLVFSFILSIISAIRAPKVAILKSCDLKSCDFCMYHLSGNCCLGFTGSLLEDFEKRQILSIFVLGLSLVSFILIL
jgi:hypothetical protein